MKISVLVNRGGSLHDRGKTLFVSDVKTEEGFTLIMQNAPFPMSEEDVRNGIRNTCGYFDLAAGDFWEYEEAVAVETATAMKKQGGEEQVKHLLQSIEKAGQQ